MSYETIVAVYDTPDHAAQAVKDLEAAGVPSSAIDKFARNGKTTATTPHQEPGFWARMFGGEPEYGHDTTVYDRSVESGSTVVTVKASEEHLEHVMDILERHNPVDIDERAATYGAGTREGTPESITTDTTTSATTEPAGIGSAGTGPEGMGMGIAGTGTTSVETRSDATRDADRKRTGTVTDGGETIPLSEEQLSVGKRAINRGTTRIRRYVVETPVEEKVALRDETVSVERRPVAEERTVTNPDFTDKVVEVTETAEEPVVSKTTRVREEVVINKQFNERTETIRDTVRREDVEITKEPGSDRSVLETATERATPKV